MEIFYIRLINALKAGKIDGSQVIIPFILLIGIILGKIIYNIIRDSYNQKQRDIIKGVIPVARNRKERRGTKRRACSNKQRR
ncbi:MAG: hypothetical protein ACRC23_01480 [Aeromonas jandaei]